MIREINHSWLSIKQAGRKLLAQLQHDLTFEQLMVLFLLEERDGQNLRALAEQADRERTTMTRMVDGLERRNLVVRVPDKTDGRNKLVYLTRQGRRLTEELDSQATDFDRKALKGLTKKQIAEATTVLEKISRNLQAGE